MKQRHKPHASGAVRRPSPARTSGFPAAGVGFGVAGGRASQVAKKRRMLAEDMAPAADVARAAAVVADEADEVATVPPPIVRPVAAATIPTGVTAAVIDAHEDACKKGGSAAQTMALTVHAKSAKDLAGTLLCCSGLLCICFCSPCPDTGGVCFCIGRIRVGV